MYKNTIPPGHSYVQQDHNLITHIIKIILLHLDRLQVQLIGAYHHDTPWCLQMTCRKYKIIDL